MKHQQAGQQHDDASLIDAMSVPVPAGLAERILVKRRRHLGTRRAMAAVACTLVLTIASVAAYRIGRDDPFARAGIDFVMDMEVHQILDARPVDPRALARVAEELDVKLPGRTGEVRYIGTCPFEGTIAHHVVVITPEGKATLLLFPEKRLRAKGDASARGLHSVARPAGTGSVVIVGSSHAVERVEDAITRS